MKGASPLCPPLSEDPWLHATQDGAQPCQGERTGRSFPYPITSSLTHHDAPLLWPALTPFLTWLRRHVPTNLLSLFLAFFLSFVSAICMFLTTCFLMQGTDFSHGPFLHHPPLLPPPCTNVHARAASPCPCLMLPSTHLSFTNAFQQRMTGLSFRCLHRTDFMVLSFMPKKEGIMNTLLSAVLIVWSTSINLMAASALPGSARRAGPSDNGYIYSICIAYVPIAAKVVNKQMLSIKQWESRIIIFDRWMRMTGLKRLPRSFMQIAFLTAWISASMRRLRVWKGSGKSSAHPATRPPLESDVNLGLCLVPTPQGRRCERRVSPGAKRGTAQSHSPSHTPAELHPQEQDHCSGHGVKSARPFERGLLPSRDFPGWWRPQWVWE